MNGHTLPRLVRGDAIGAYANLEAALCRLLQSLLSVDVATAGIIFYRVVNTRSRNTILNDLLGHRYGQKFDAFWNSALKHIRILDGERNEIAHWHFVTEVGADDGPNVRLDDQSKGLSVLHRPNSWLANPQASSRKTHEDMLTFTGKCHFMSRAIDVFATVVSVPEPFPVPQSWHDICLQPLPYPPPDNHPLSQNYREHKTPPQP